MPSVRITPRIRVVIGRNIALGPGKVELLDQIERTGSLRKAATAMEMSYMRAWMLVQTMNSCFREPLVKAARGGTHGGRAELTDTGREMLVLYRAMENVSLEAMQATWRVMQKRLKA